MVDWTLCSRLERRQPEQSALEKSLTGEHGRSAVGQHNIKRMCSIGIDSDGVRKNYIHRKERPLGK